MSKTLATLQAELTTFNAWSDSNPMKSVCIAFTLEDIACLRRVQESEARTQVAISKRVAFNALPWFKRLFRSA